MKRIELRPLSSFRVFPSGGPVTAVAWSPGDDAVIVSTTETRGMLRTPGRKPRELPLSGVPDSLLEPVDGRRVLLVDRRGAEVAELDTTVSVLLEGLSGHVQVSHDGGTALGLGREGQLVLRGTRDGAVLQSLVCPGVIDYALSGDGSTVTALSRGSLWTWRAPFHDAPRRLERPELVDTYRIALSADGARAASVHRQQFVQLWDLAAGAELACVFRFRDWTCHQLVLDPSGTFALVADARGVTVFDFERREKSEPLEWASAQSGLVSRTGQLVWRGPPGGQVETFRVSAQRHLVRAPEFDDVPMSVVHFVNVPTSDAARVELAAGTVTRTAGLRAPRAQDGQTLYAAGSQARVEEEQGTVLAVSSDGGLLLVCSWWSQLLLIEASTGKRLYEQPQAPHARQTPASGAFSRDGRRVAVGTATGELLIYELSPREK